MPTVSEIFKFYLIVDYGSWFDYTLSWEKIIRNNPDFPLYVMSYEDMKKVGDHLASEYLHYFDFGVFRSMLFAVSTLFYSCIVQLCSH